MKYLFIVLILYLVVCFLLAGCVVSAPPYQNMAHQAVYLEEPGSLGSGVVVNDRCVVTAAHVVGEFEQMTAETFDRNPHIVKLVDKDDARDVAVLCSETSLGAPAVTFAKTMPEQYTPLFTIGAPLGKKWFLTEGRYQSAGMASVLGAPGNSGGGVWTNDGLYIGFMDALGVMARPPSFNIFNQIAYIIEVEDIKPMLDRNHIEYKEAA